MSKFTLEEKVNYNRNRDSNFSMGYVFGVTLYNDYVKMDKKTKATINSIVTNSKELARNGDEYGKGFMRGMRDAAKDRKEKQAKRKR